jgi:hypothetical protein
MSMTETILWLLENGKWHHLKEIEEKSQLNGYEIKSITNFLAEYNFVKLDETGHKVKLDSPTKRFLNKIRQLENEENL